MNGHEKIRLTLYDYLRGELGDEEKMEIAAHLAGCARCSREAEELRDLLKVFAAPSVRPSDALPDGHWKTFIAGVERRIAAAGRPAPVGPVRRVSDAVRDFLIFRRPAAIRSLAFSATAAVVVAVAVWALLPVGGDGGRPGVSPDGTPESGKAVVRGNDVAGIPDTMTDFDRRVAEYFRRSKTLLVGMTNSVPGEGDAHDLDVERSASRRLVHEARYLRNGPVDERSWRLMEDLDEIMIELANLDEGSGRSSSVMLRDGIKSRNLLFKLRMREARSAGTPVRQAVYTK